MIHVSEAGVVKTLGSAADARRLVEVLRAFDGLAMVRPCDVVGCTVSMEQLQPGYSAADLVIRGRDEEATVIVADLIRQMSPREPPHGTPTVRDLVRSFGTYRSSGDTQIAAVLVDEAERIYLELCDSQHDVRLLHGDLHQGNILFDDTRGWIAIDPKGVVGEVAYEVGASLRNPIERPDILASTAALERRVKVFEAALGLNAARMFQWAYVQSVLAAIWLVEDEGHIDPDHPFMACARTTRMLIE